MDLASGVPQAQQARPSQAQQSPAQPDGASTGMNHPMLAQLPPDLAAAILRLLQSGVVRPDWLKDEWASALVDMIRPPQPNPDSVTTIASATSIPPPASAPSPPQSQAPQIGMPGHEEVNTDKEDGELEEGEDMGIDLGSERERDFLRPPPTGPRQRSTSPKDLYGRSSNKRSFTFDQPQAAIEHPAKSRKVLDYGSRSGTNGIGNGDGKRRADLGTAAKNFVRVMHQTGYSFEQLAQEVQNTGALRNMYRELGLPIPTGATMGIGGQLDSTPGPQQQQNGTSATKSGSNSTETLKAADKKKPVLPAKASLDPQAQRQEYLARLSAVKSGKPGAPKSSSQQKSQDSAPQQAPLDTTDTTKDVPAQSLPVTPFTYSASRPQLSPPEQAKPATAARKVNKVNTELVQQKMAKLEADRAAKAAAMSHQKARDSAPAASSPPTTPSNVANAGPQVQRPGGVTAYGGLGNGIAGITAASPASATHQPPLNTVVQPQPSQVALQPSFSPAPSTTPGRPFSALPGLSLPGLFMGGYPPVHQPSSAPQQVQSAAPSSSNARPAPPMFSASVNQAAGSASQPTESKPAPASASSRRPFGLGRVESDSEPVIINVSEDEDDEDYVPDVDQPLIDRPAAIASNLPPQLTGSSTTSTSGHPTPMSKMEYEAKVKAHASALEKAKKDLAERQARFKGLSKPLGTANFAQPLTAQTDASSPASGKSTPAFSAIQAAQHAVPSRPMSAAAVARETERAFLMKRQAELEAQLRADGTTRSPAAPNRRMHETLPISEDASVPASPEKQDKIKAVEETTVLSDVQNDLENGMEQMEVSSGEEGEVSDEAAPMDGPGEQKDSQATSVGTREPTPGDAGLVTIAQHVAEEVEGGQITEEAMDESSDSEEEDEDNDLDAPTGPEPAPASAFVQKDANDSSAEFDEHEEEEEYEPQPDISLPTISDTTDAVVETMAVTDDLAPELQPPTSLQTITPASSALTRPSAQTEGEAVSDTALHAPAHHPQARSYYRPYISPLAHFKDFRFHPSYADTVPGGYRSLTYSHQIDPQGLLCPNEAQGNKCKDSRCEGMHWADFGISGT